jgi:DNA-binding PadR family transcriptional regulator
LRKQSIKAVMDMLLLAGLRNSAMSGYDAIGYIHKKFGVLVSSGTVYSHLYALEREGLVEAGLDSRKRVYEITEKGEQMLEITSKSNMELLNTLKNM